MKLTEQVKADIYTELEGLARKYSPSRELANFCVAEIFDELKGEINKYDNLNELRASLYIKLLQSPCLRPEPYITVKVSQQERRLMQSKYVFGAHEVRFRSK
jgi:hypothetical protein